MKKGYYNIGQIRSDIDSGDLKLEPRQLVGVEFYEQFQEKMERHEGESTCYRSFTVSIFGRDFFVYDIFRKLLFIALICLHI